MSHEAHHVLVLCRAAMRAPYVWLNVGDTGIKSVTGNGD